jgi:hypothetical protein
MPITVQHIKSCTVTDGTDTNLVRPIDWNSVHTLTVGLTASEIQALLVAGTGLTKSTAAGGITFAFAPASFYEPWPAFGAATFAPGNGTWYFDPFNAPYVLDSGKINHAFNMGTGISAPLFVGSGTFSTGTYGIHERYGTLYVRNALYTQGAGGSSASLYSVWSDEAQIRVSQRVSVTSTGAGGTGIQAFITNWVSMPTTWDSLGGYTYGTLGSDTSVGSAGTSIAVSKISTHTNLVTCQNLLTGGLFWPTGLAYKAEAIPTWKAFHMSTTTNAASTGAQAWTRGTVIGGLAPNALALTEVVNTAYRAVGTSLSASTSNFQAGHGFYAAAGAAPPSPVALSDIVVNATNQRFYWNYAKVGAGGGAK